MRMILTLLALMGSASSASAVDLKEASTAFVDLTKGGYQLCSLAAREGTALIILEKKTEEEAQKALDSCIGEWFETLKAIVDMNKMLLRENYSAQSTLKLAYTSWRIEMESLRIGETPKDVLDTNFNHYAQSFRTEVDW